MIVIGNDIVKLSDAQNKRSFTRKGIEKFFTVEELDFAASYPDSNPLECLWAIKESAYKCLMKTGHNKAFSPAKYKCTIVQENSVFYAKINYQKKQFFAKCTEDDEFVRCVASNNKKILNFIKSFHIAINRKEDRSEHITKKVKHLVNQDIVFTKSKNNIPFIITKDGKKQIEVSLSTEGSLNYVSILPEWISNQHSTANKPLFAYA
ncbi:MAG: 4'-phosphopantetheinyl transferase superfamily protein [Bacteroidota bacterium]|nr:4'-phosphopantetheinyl transferase superfamily protein [Bacteroidota bacterium]